ncbi:MAG: hypothetical protein IJU50_04120, partial [Lachnospiraceae bacterium]|nr:hypothetical protein [Lachnospiraceae bacterium]
MKKKILSCMLAGALAISMLAGCGGGASGDGSGSGSGSSGSSSGGSADAAGEKVLNFGCYDYADTLDPSDQINAAWDVMR